MNKEVFNNMSFINKISYLNDKLKEGNTVKSIREDIGISEKLLQKEIRANGYKFDNKSKQYKSISNKIDNEISVLDNNTNVLDIDLNNEKIQFYLDNFDLFKSIIDKFNSNTKSNTKSNTITIDLVDDKHLKPSAKGFRVNEFVYRDWQKFCDNQPYTKMDLLSMALKEYMEKYSK